MGSSPHDSTRVGRGRSIASVLTACVLVLAAATIASPAAAQNDPNSPNLAPAAQTTVAPADRGALEAQVNALENQLDDLDGAIPQKQALVDQHRAELDDLDAQLQANQQALDDVVEARVAPARARTEIIISLYIEGPSDQRTFTEFVRSGQMSNDSLRRDRLFEAAEEYTRTRLAELDAQAEALRTERDALQARRVDTAAALDAAAADLDAAVALREETVNKLDEARAALKSLLALSNRAPLTGASDYPLRPAIGIKIDNSDEARPQTGLTKADIVYDIIVEGGITRFLAMFQSQDASRIGPVRSARTSDISIMAAYNNPIFAFSGGNDGVLAAVRVAPVTSLTESSAPRAFVRDEGRLAPHNLFTSTSGLYGAAGSAGGIPNSQFVFRKAGEPSAVGRPVGGVTVNIGFESVTYRWNGTGWDRATGGVPTEDTTAGTVAPQNVVVQFTNYATSPADAESPDALTVGQGDAWIFTDGKVIEGRWARGIATSPVQYLDAAGNQIALTPGQTWVELPRPGSATIG